MHIDTINMELPIMYIKGSQVNFLNYDVFQSLKIVLILASSADPDEMQRNISSGSALFAKGPLLGISSIQRVYNY